jgi:sulfopyruvate decarboxylase subunit alpha
MKSASQNRLEAPPVSLSVSCYLDVEYYFVYKNVRAILKSQEAAMDRGEAICRELKKAGIGYIVWLPDSETHFMHDAMEGDPDLKVVKVCREGEAVAICCGLHLGGARGALLVENAGIFDSGNTLKWATAFRLPVVMMIGYLMHRRMERTPEGMMLRGAKDYTEPFLDAFDVAHYLIDADEDVPKVGQACQEAQQTGRPVALLLTSADGFVPGS